MTDLMCTPSYARSLLRDLLTAAATTTPAAPPALAPTPGMERFTAALARATAATGQRSQQLAHYCEQRAQDTAGHLRSIELVDAELAASLNRQV
ncbi:MULTISPECIES: hypothetical protein [Corynebacterium]|uniref:hypothetical protein n=1 Tax=Corynebacterium TaxID=1716 RepID=UPI00124E228A|nr:MULTISPECIES: hypothetical protein [Corynebacterium]